MNFKGKNFLKYVLLAMLTTINIVDVVAQENTFGRNFLFELLTTTKRARISEPVYVGVSDTAIYQIFDHLNGNDNSRNLTNVPKSKILLGVKLNPKLTRYYSAVVQSVSKEYASFLISDSSDAVLVAMGINEKNAADFRYHVVENDSLELVPWSAIPKLAQNYGARRPYGFLGKFSAPGKRIMIEVVNIKDYSIRDGVIFDWRVNYRPILKQITIGTYKDYFNLAYLERNRGYATKFDRFTGAPLDFKFPVESIRSITLQFKKQETMVHAVFLLKNIDGKRDTTRLGFVDQFGYFELENTLFKQPGNYNIIIQKQDKIPIWDEKQMLRISFDVSALPLLARKIALKQLLPWIIGGAALLILGFLGYNFYSKKRLFKAHQERATIQFKLKAIRAQLNPHFMFNALSSIQNLMNKKELLEANHYLAKFAGLTRTVLNTSEKELISLEEELEIAKDYLQMEQLRFGFNFNFEIAEGISTANTEIPAMILQPFVENAVKHGIPLLQKDGLITVVVSRSNTDLVLKITDNGKGFNAAKDEEKHRSFGLKLSNNRIDLLNHIYKEQPIFLDIVSNPGKTIVTITLTKWI